MYKMYSINYKNIDKDTLYSYILEKNLNIKYQSPVLDVLFLEIDTYNLLIIEKEFPELIINEAVKGKLQSDFEIDFIPSIQSVGANIGIQSPGFQTVVGVLDSGVNKEMVAFRKDYTGYGIELASEHGNLVAKIIKRLAPAVSLRSYKICHSVESGIEEFHFLSALDEAVKDCSIINLSLGFTIPYCEKDNPCHICQSINKYSELYENKVFVVAAGNEGKFSDEDSIECPGNAIESITVGSLDDNGRGVAKYSGKGPIGGNKPNLLTTGTIFDKNIRDMHRGTSFSTPIVTGVICSVYIFFDGKRYELKEKIYTTAKDLDLPSHHQGYGALNIAKFSEVCFDEEDNITSEEQRGFTGD
jgi:hypothetical protein